MTVRSLALIVVLAACSKAKRGEPPTVAPARDRAPVVVVVDAAPPDAPPTHTALASMRRGMCLGPCPTYTITVFEDGALEYQGESSVKLTGKHEGHLTAAEVRAVRDAFAKAGYAGLGDFTHVDRTDHPEMALMFQGKKLRHYTGDSHAPGELFTLEDELDRIVHIEQFIGTEQERQKLDR